MNVEDILPFEVAGVPGFEPGRLAPKTSVLPLDDTPASCER